MERNELDKHLTNTVLMRIDYIPIPDKDVDELNQKIAEEFLVKTHEFQQIKPTFVRAIDIKINDPSIQNFNDYINVKEKSKIQSYEYYKIVDDSINIKLIFNRQFAVIEVDQNYLYQKYENYKVIFLKLLDILNKNDIIINRFGLRKFNDIFFKENTDIYKYVKKMYFNFECDELFGENVENFISEKRFVFKKDFYNVNLITNTSQGILDSIETKRVAFDIDIYVEDILILKKLFDENKRTEFIDCINNSVFLIYKNLLENKLMNILKKGSNLDDENIIYGVDYNE